MNLPDTIRTTDGDVAVVNCDHHYQPHQLAEYVAELLQQYPAGIMLTGTATEQKRKAIKSHLPTSARLKPESGVLWIRYQE